MKNIYVRVARWLVQMIGGILIGGGLVLHAQIAVAHVFRKDVENTFALWRGIGRLTFAFQDEVVQTAFVLDDIPPVVLTQGDRAAWVLVVIGCLMTFAAMLIRVRGSQPGKIQPSKSQPSKSQPRKG